MKNKEYYDLNDLKYDYEFDGTTDKYLIIDKQGHCILEVERKVSLTQVIEDTMAWLEEEHKPRIELGVNEKVVLKNIDSTYKWIGRTSDIPETIVVFEYKPKFVDNDKVFVTHGDYAKLEAFSHIFQSIEPDTCYKIEELLDD